MVAWSAIGSAVGGLLSSLNFGSTGSTSVFKSNQIANHQFNLQKNYTKWLNENGYSQMRTGLEAAGYNPLLAVGATPQSGTVGLGSAVSGNTATFDGSKVVDALNTMASTAQVKTGVLGSIFGTDLVNTAKRFMNDSGVSKGLERLVKKSLNTANSAINKVDKVTDKIDKAYNGVLKGYISNTANSQFDYVPEYDDLGKLPRELSRYH